MSGAIPLLLLHAFVTFTAKIFIFISRKTKDSWKWLQYSNTVKIQEPRFRRTGFWYQLRTLITCKNFVTLFLLLIWFKKWWEEQKGKFCNFWYYKIYLLNTIGLSPGGSSTVHIYTQTVHRTAQLTTLVWRLSGIRTQSGQNKINNKIKKIVA